MDRPLVSVVITSYNQKELLPRAIDSVLEQTYRPLQVVIVDDCSTDGSQDLVRQYARDNPDMIKPFVQPNNVGIPKNKNTGFRLCDGALLTYLDGDDFYYPRKIADEVKTLQQHDWARVVYSNFMFINEEGEPVKQWTHSDQMPTGNIFKEVFARQFPGQVLYRNELMERKVLETINYLDEKFEVFEDWEARIRMSKQFRVAYCPSVGSAYTKHTKGVSAQTSQQKQLRVMKTIIRKNEHLLKDLPAQERKHIQRQLFRNISKTELLCYPHKLQLFAVFKHVWRFPQDFTNFRFLMNAFLPRSIIRVISRGKRMLSLKSRSNAH